MNGTEAKFCPICSNRQGHKPSRYTCYKIYLPLAAPLYTSTTSTVIRRPRCHPSVVLLRGSSPRVTSVAQVVGAGRCGPPIDGAPQAQAQNSPMSLFPLNSCSICAPPLRPVAPWGLRPRQRPHHAGFVSHLCNQASCRRRTTPPTRTKRLTGLTLTPYPSTRNVCI